MRIGIFGGTFDPIHTGHLIVATHVHEVLHLDRTLFVPAALAPHKQGQVITPARDRLAMLELAVADNPAFDIAGDELARGGVSYTIDTISQFGKRFPGDALFLLIGSDNAADFLTWKDPDRILERCTVVAMVRPGAPLDSASVQKLIPGAMVVAVPAIAISSRRIREKVRSGASIRYLVPEGVHSYILKHRLYR